jgi:hypothetical protein
MISIIEIMTSQFSFTWILSYPTVGHLIAPSLHYNLTQHLTEEIEEVTYTRIQEIPSRRNCQMQWKYTSSLVPHGHRLVPTYGIVMTTLSHL